MREPLIEDNWRQELPNFGFWPHNHASWYLAATSGKLATTADKYNITSSSGHAQAWYDSIGLTKYQAGVHGLYQVATLPIYTTDDKHCMECDYGCRFEASECYTCHEKLNEQTPKSFEYMCVGETTADLKNRMNLMNRLTQMNHLNH